MPTIRLTEDTKRMLDEYARRTRTRGAAPTHSEIVAELILCARTGRAPGSRAPSDDAIGEVRTLLDSAGDRMAALLLRKTDAAEEAASVAQRRITELEDRASTLSAEREALAARVCELEGTAAESDRLRARLMEADEHLRGLAGKLEESRRARDELAARLEDALAEADRERKGREDSERLVRQLSERLRRYATSGRTCDGADGEEDAITWRAFETDRHPIPDAPTPEAADREGAWRLPRLRDEVANSVAASRALRRNDH